MATLLIRAWVRLKIKRDGSESLRGKAARTVLSNLNLTVAWSSLTWSRPKWGMWGLPSPALLAQPQSPKPPRRVDPGQQTVRGRTGSWSWCAIVGPVSGGPAFKPWAATDPLSYSSLLLPPHCSACKTGILLGFPNYSFPCWGERPVLSFSALTPCRWLNQSPGFQGTRWATLNPYMALYKILNIATDLKLLLCCPIHQRSPLGQDFWLCLFWIICFDLSEVACWPTANSFGSRPTCPAFPLPWLMKSQCTSWPSPSELGQDEALPHHEGLISVCQSEKCPSWKEAACCGYPGASQSVDTWLGWRVTD